MRLWTCQAQSAPTPPPSDTSLFEPKDFLSPSVALITLLFTVGTFWWNNWRRGRVSTATPRSFAVTWMQSKAYLLLPLPLSNTGARPINVTAVRLVPLTPRRFGPFRWSEAGPPLDNARIFDELEPMNAKRAFATNFVLEGRATVVRVSEFVGESEGSLPTEGSVYRIEVHTTHKRRWKSAGKIQLHLNAEQQKSARSSYIVYDNLASLG